MLYFSNITKIYEGNIVALSDMTIKVHRGDYICLVGPGGAGKSTFIRIAFGVIPPTRGEVFLDGTNLADISRRKLLKKRQTIGIIFQQSNLIPSASVGDNVRLPLDISGASKREKNEAVLRVLAKVGLEHRKDDFPSELSGGERQRVAIARAIVHQPTLLLADEPTQNLDRHMSGLIAEIFAELHDRGATIINATHDSRLFEGAFSRALRLSHGRIVT